MSIARAVLDRRLEEIGGCGDGNCQVVVRPGMHTNGGCRCLRNDWMKVQRVINAYKAFAEAVEKI